MDFDSHEPRSYDETLAAYLNADSVESWLRDELTDYFGDNDRPAESEEVEARVDELLDNLEGRLEALRSTAIEVDELLAFELMIDSDGDERSLLVLNALPHPVELLWVVANYAAPGDMVTVGHVHPWRKETVSAPWPFGMDTALIMTSPEPEAHFTGAEEEFDTSFTAELRAQGPLADAAAAIAPVFVFGAAVGAAAVAAGVALGAALFRKK